MIVAAIGVPLVSYAEDTSSKYSYSDSTTSGTAAGVGSCGGGLLTSALTALGISKATAIAGDAAVTGGAGTAAASNVAAVPVVDNAAALQRKGQSTEQTTTAISNNAIFGIETTELVTNNTLNCVARAIARAVLQHVTKSVVNWARNGFEGTPSFVSNPTKFFTNVADTAAGNYLKSSDLAFLCSPFKLDVKVAIANAYRGSSDSGLQCTLSGVTGNINNFMGNFSQGGWPAFISMTTNPANQPFGAYIQASEGLQSAITKATGLKRDQLAISGGFLDFTEKRNCKTYNKPEDVPNVGTNQVVDYGGGSEDGSDTSFSATVCDEVTVTPGKIIETSLSKTLGTNIDSLNSAKYFDEIISALITGLYEKVVMGSGGLLGSGKDYGSSSDFGGGVDSVASLKSQVSGQIPGYRANADTLETIITENKNSITTVRNSAIAARSCLNNANGYSGLTAEQQSSVTSDLSTIASDITTLDGFLSIYNGSLDNLQNSRSALDQYDADASSVSSANLTSLTNLVIKFTNSTVTGLPDAAAITAAYEDQASLKSDLSTMTTRDSGILTDCQGLGVPQQTPVTTTTTGTNTAGTNSTPVPVCILTVSPATMEAGSTAQLTLISSYGTSASVDHGVGAIALNGSAQVAPITPGAITYTATVTGTGGTGTCSAQLGVTTSSPTQNNTNEGGA
jgi:hypothetical protein